MLPENDLEYTNTTPKVALGYPACQAILQAWALKPTPGRWYVSGDTALEAAELRLQAELFPPGSRVLTEACRPQSEPGQA